MKEEFNEFEENTPKKKKRFNLFDWYYRQSKKIDESDDIKALENPNIPNFFRVLGKKFGKLLSVNLLFVFTNFPIIFILIAMTGLLSQTATAPLYQMWGPLNGAMYFESNAGVNSLYGIYGIQANVTIINTPTKVMFILGLLILFTWGFAKVGTSYILRNMISGEPVFPFSDFIYVIKRNIRQSLILGIIDAIFMIMFGYNLYFLFINYSTNSLNPIMLFFTFVMFMVFLTIRQYAFTMIYTFDLPLTKIIKNSVFFVMLGAKRNFMAFLASLVIILLNFGLFVVFMPLGAIMPFILTIALIDFVWMYATYPNILKYMADTSENHYDDSDFEESEDEEKIETEDTIEMDENA